MAVCSEEGGRGEGREDGGRVIDAGGGGEDEGDFVCEEKI